MTLYHGSKIKGLREIRSLDSLRAANISVEISQSTDIDRESFTDVVFLTSNVDLARQYAGKDGVVYTVSAPDAVLYQDHFGRNMSKLKKSKCLLKKKLKKLRSNKSVFVAPVAFVL